MRHISFICTTTLFLFFCSCSPNYIPNKVNSPLLEGKGDLRAIASVGTTGVDPQVAYAITNHIGIVANGSFLDWKEGDNTHFSSNRFGEAGAGYYTRLANILILEAYGGAGYGKLTLKSESYTEYNNFTRYFIQPAIGISTRFFSTSVAGRFVLNNIRYRSSLGGSGTFTGMHFDPALTLSFGTHYIKSFTQIGASLPLYKDAIDYYYFPLILTTGISIDLGHFFR